MEKAADLYDYLLKNDAETKKIEDGDQDVMYGLDFLNCEIILNH